MNDVLRKVEQVVLIVFPAVIATLGVFHLTGAIQVAQTVEQVTMVALGAVVTIFEVIVSKDVFAGK